MKSDLKIVNRQSSIVNPVVFSHFESLYPEDCRANEIEKVLTFIKEGNSCQLISIPGAGRLNLFGLLTYNTKVRLKHLGVNQKWFHFVYLNFSEVKQKSLSDITKFVFIGLLDSIKERKQDEEYKVISKILKDSIEFNDEMVIFSGLKKAIDYLAIEKELTVVFLFDRFETYVPFLTSEFFTNLKIIRNRAKYRFSCVFSLNRPLEDSIEPELMSDFYEFVAGHAVYLPIFDKPGIDFRISYLEKLKNRKLDKKIIDKVLELTAGHGKLTRICLETVFSNPTIQQPASPDASQGGSSNFSNFLISQKTVLGGLTEILNSLTPNEQNLLASKNKRLASSYLESIGLLKNGKITIPLFEEFTNRSSKKQAISLQELSENLTSLEYKLLKFLIENPNIILGREEIVNAVWTEIKSRDGVTDQAVDQLIFRLRKKIEDDPNNPIHVQTIKGRGVRFTP